MAPVTMRKNVPGKYTVSQSCLFTRLSHAGADHLEHATAILSLCHGIFTDWSILSIHFLFYNKGNSAPVTQ